MLNKQNGTSFFIFILSTWSTITYTSIKHEHWSCFLVYQLIAHGRWFSPGTPASSTTKTRRHDIAESGVKHNKTNQIKYIKEKKTGALLKNSSSIPNRTKATNSSDSQINLTEQRLFVLLG
jgi:hypothetical protein